MPAVPVGQHTVRLGAHLREGHRLQRYHGLGVFGEIAQARIAFLADSLIE
jgi:hypothetical protein